MGEWLFKTAQDEWKTTTLGKLCRLGGGDIQTGPFGSQLHASDYVTSGVPSVMPQNIGDNIIVEDGIARITIEDARRLSRYLLRTGDIVYSRRGDVERRALVRPEQDGWLCGTGCLRVRLGDAADSRFMSYYLDHPNVREWIVRHAVGATMPNLNTGILGATPITLPPRGTQLAIAAVLGALDDKIAVNERISTTLLSLADSFFERAVAGLVAGSESFGSVAEVHGGGTPRTSETSYWNGDIAWATPSDVTALSSPYLFATSRTITQAGLDNCASQLYPAGSIFMTSRATIGSFAVPQIPTAVNQGFIVVVPPRSEFRWWLFHEMKSRVHEMIGLANGSTFLELSRKNFRTMQVRLGDPSDIERFDAQVDPLHSRAMACVKENTTLAQLRDTLLPKLMSGETRVREAEGIVGGAL